LPRILRIELWQWSSIGTAQAGTLLPAPNPDPIGNLSSLKGIAAVSRLEHQLETFPRARHRVIFHGDFYGRQSFCCKTTQFYVKPCECLTAELPNVGNAVQSSEKLRKSFSLN
jgi:hypothetical protein